MENKILDFVKGINKDLDNPILSYYSDGYTEAVRLEQYWVFNDNDYQNSLVDTVALANAVKHMSSSLEVLNELLVEELDKFFRKAKEQLKEKFPKAKLGWERKAVTVFYLIISGEYDDIEMSDFVEDIENEFSYIFDGCFALNYEF